MNTDSVFFIGNSHRICQDYVVHNTNRIILSDGCSSALHSDVGSRLIAHSALNLPHLSPLSLINRIYDSSYKLGLPVDSLCATFIDLSVDENETEFTVKIIGDGCIAARQKESQKIEITNISFPSGAPFYLRYLLDDESFNKYLMLFGHKIHINDEEFSIIEDLKPQYTISRKFPCSSYDLVAVFSDGITSFQNKTKNGISIPIESLISQFLAFKGYTGEFVQRRARRALKDLAEQGIDHYDDFSMGVIYNAL
jgi:hypothetical protein